ncbi:MAG: copper resistance protein NlpE [Methylobacter sp.]|nr:MAG: copper resistance protein NlpE [Methylobacter sp.]
MRTFRQIPAFFLFIAIFSACNPVFAETAETSDTDTHHAQNSLDWPGIYHGFMPCDDCKGVKSTLALNQNSSYILITQYVGKSEREIVEKGKFSWGDKRDTIVLTPRNSSTTRQYFVGENMLIQLDDNGNRISGKLADRYILRRTDVTKASSSSHLGH